MTYMVDGKQLIVLPIGGAGQPAELVALRWLTDKTPALHFSSRFLPLKHKSKLPAFGILLL